MRLFLVMVAILAGSAGFDSTRLSLPPEGPASIRRQEKASSSLTFRSEKPGPGSVLGVEYEPLPELAGEMQLHLRARLRTVEDGSYNSGMGSRTVAVLDRAADGSFYGSFRLPEQVVFAAFAVEDPGATQVDGKDGLFWEILVHHEDGRPNFDALRQRFNDHMGRNEPGVLETARETARLYPEKPQSWSSLRAAEGWFLSDDGAEERAAAHTERARDFDRAFQGRTDLSADEVAFLYWYGTGEIRDRWRLRLLQDFPDHFFAAQERASALVRDNPDSPGAVKNGLDSLWSEVSEREAKMRVLQVGFSVARRQEDVQGMLTWTKRWRDLDPAAGRSAALMLSATEGARDEGIALLSEMVRATEAAKDEERALGATADTHRESSKRQAALLKRALGDALIEAGRIEDGVAVLESVAAEGWWPNVFRSLGEAFEAEGRAEEALWFFAALATDPGTTQETVDSLAIMAGVEGPAWNEAVESAREEMVRRTLSSSGKEPLPTIRLADPNGSEMTLQELLGPEATVIVMWSRSCGYSHQAMPRIEALTKELAGQGVPFLALTRDGLKEGKEYLEEEGFEVLALFDLWGEVGRALNAWGTPQYYLLDGEGRLRFPVTSLADIPRQVLALRSEPGSS